MKKLLLINGSPNKAQSRTLSLSRAFAGGFASKAAAETTEITVNELDIIPCGGCQKCLTTGVCIMKDDMEGVLKLLHEADIVIWSVPVHFAGLPSAATALFERMLPDFEYEMEERPDGGTRRKRRYVNAGQKHVLICSCGCATIENNCEPLVKRFELLFDGALTTIVCPQSEIVKRAELCLAADGQLEKLRLAGEEFALTGALSSDMTVSLLEPMFPPAAYIKMNEAFGRQAQNADDPEGMSRLIAAAYDPASYRGKPRVLELHYTDRGETYTLRLGETECTFEKGESGKYTTRVETPFDVWRDISMGKISGARAMAERKYRVLGDMDLLIFWDDFFKTGTQGKNSSRAAQGDRPTSLLIFLVPFITLWCTLEISPYWGGMAGIIACAVMQGLAAKKRFCLYDRLGMTAVTAISLTAIATGSLKILLPLSYLMFGLMWLVSCFLKVPLSAHYSMYKFGGRQALANPMFILTNRIISAWWAALYMLTPVWTYFMIGTHFQQYLVVLNTILPLTLFAVTLWFQKWHPEYVARGGRI